VVHYQNGSQLLISWSWGIAGGDGMHDVLGSKATLTFPCYGQQNRFRPRVMPSIGRLEAHPSNL